MGRAAKNSSSGPFSLSYQKKGVLPRPYPFFLSDIASVHSFVRDHYKINGGYALAVYYMKITIPSLLNDLGPFSMQGQCGYE